MINICLVNIHTKSWEKLMECITKDSPIYVLVEYLETIVDDKCPRNDMSSFELGMKIGNLQLLDTIRGLCK